MRESMLLVVFFLMLALVTACGTSAWNQGCDNIGSTDECESGLICTGVPGGAVCYQICFSQDDCWGNWNCNGVANTELKSCQVI